MDAQERSELICDVARDVPFNNLSPLLIERGMEVPPGIGGNCIYQHGVLGKRLEERGLVPKYVEPEGGGHLNVVCSDEGESFVWDVDLLMREPISLAKRGARIVDADPQGDGREPWVLCNIQDENRFNLRKGFGAYAARGTAMQFDMSVPSRVFDQLPDERGSFKAVTANPFLSVDVLVEGVINKLRYDVLTEVMTVGRVRGEYFGADVRGDEYQEGFWGEMERFSTLVGMDARALFELFQVALEIRLEMFGTGGF